MRSLISFAAIAVLTISASLANADHVVDNATVTVYNGTPAYGTVLFTPTGGSYPATDSIDAAPNTDYASGNAGAGTFLDFNFGSQIKFTQIADTDRVTSGGANGGFVGGTGSFNTQYEYIFSNSPTFATTVGTVVSPVLPIPSPSTSPADFLSTLTIPGITAQYVQWQVLAGGSNNGASNFSFTATPEPSSMILCGLGAIGLFFAARRRRKA